MQIRPATPSDFEEIAAIHIESWQDTYAYDLPKEFITGKLANKLTHHWRSIEIQDTDIVLSRKIVWEDLSAILKI